jgi:hypothetical protein
MGMRSAPVSLVALAFVVALSGAALAQAPPAGNDKVMAQALFEDGRKLAGEGKYAEACPKFADSQRLDSSPSTLLNLANCWEKLGRTATAWATYKEAESAASATKRLDYMATAERHASALAPVLARLTVGVQQAVDGMQLKRDGSLLGAAEWGAAIPIDAGSHTLEASAPGYKRWVSKAEVPRDGAQVTVTVPPLETMPSEASARPAAPPMTNAPSVAPVAAAPVPPEARPSGHPQRVIGWVTGGAGVVGLGFSGVFAVVAYNKNQDSLKDCPNNPNVCSAAGVSRRNDALFAGDVATVAFGIGAAALAAGIILWLTAPSGADGHGATVMRVAFAPTAGGGVLQGTW